MSTGLRLGSKRKKWLIAAFRSEHAPPIHNWLQTIKGEHMINVPRPCKMQWSQVKCCIETNQIVFGIRNNKHARPFISLHFSFKMSFTRIGRIDDDCCVTLPFSRLLILSLIAAYTVSFACVFAHIFLSLSACKGQWFSLSANTEHKWLHWSTEYAGESRNCSRCKYSIRAHEHDHFSCVHRHSAHRHASTASEHRLDVTVATVFFALYSITFI